MKTPSFSAKHAAGKMTSAKRAVSFRKMSWRTRKSTLFRPSSSRLTLGSDNTMSSPMMKKPFSCLPATFIISFRFRPRVRESGTPQMSSYFATTASSSARW
ncbi:MAG: hypothetical protein IPG72_04390 [Ardenticatenales bacterium]|nr:hypothetical protein [Ardenticatenales bacterium]